MPRGWALLLALAVLSGIGLGGSPPPGLVEGLCLVLLAGLALRCRTMAVDVLILVRLWVDSGRYAPGPASGALAWTAR